MNDDSILNTIVEMLGPASTYANFQTDLIIHINTAFDVLTQLGCGPEEGFAITGPVETWSDYTTDTILNMVKTYIYVRVKLAFDPPNSSGTIEVLNNLAKELEFRIGCEVDPGRKKP